MKQPTDGLGTHSEAEPQYLQADTPLENIIAMYTTPRELSAM